MKLETIGFAVLTVFLLAGCSRNVLEDVRTLTYPPDFNYLSQEKIRGTMNQFAWYTEVLARGLRGPQAPDAEQIESAISILTKMEKLSLQLGTETLTSNHDLISMNIDRFRNNIINARVALQQSPPNTYPAGMLSAYCLQCHQIADQ